MTRPTYDQILMQVAHLWSQRATCSRLAVGAVIADPDGHIVGHGYNGAPPGEPHCVHTDNLRCTRSIHAEANAIAWAAFVPGVDYTLYITHNPCWECAYLILDTPIRRVVYGAVYRHIGAILHLEDHGVRVDQQGRYT